MSEIRNWWRVDRLARFSELALSAFHEKAVFVKANVVAAVLLCARLVLCPASIRTRRGTVTGPVHAGVLH